MMQTLKTDLLIIGGGVAGLWLLNRAIAEGYSALLIEKGDLGGGQSIKSQGIIHGGTKYALNGALSQASNAISEMPDRWRACLKGEGELDLSQTKVLSEAHYMWSKDTLGAKLTTFFASKAVRGRVDNLAVEDRPKVFRNKAFKGSIYKLNELVLDVPGLIKNLATPHQQNILKLNPADAEICLKEQQVESLCWAEQSVMIKPQRVILTAGEGNDQLRQLLKLEQPEMQRRPLQMVVVRHKTDLPVFAHCVGTGSKPVVTITTHPTSNGEFAWYLGGDLAETGVDLPADQQIERAKKLIAELMPWVTLEEDRWAAFHVNRAEPKQSNLTRPDSGFVQTVGNTLVCWPTKLALAPDLSQQVLAELSQQRVKPEYIPELAQVAIQQPATGLPVWETLFCN